mmetsp:Transcript_103944/g.291133  ORF Transcript_103944/g.291133 Transcript_103944/m.291133 type:complete len:116 (-) Transcript_103944:520-867(-)
MLVVLVLLRNWLIVLWGWRTRLNRLLLVVLLMRSDRLLLGLMLLLLRRGCSVLGLLMSLRMMRGRLLWLLLLCSLSHLSLLHSLCLHADVVGQLLETLLQCGGIVVLLERLGRSV